MNYQAVIFDLDGTLVDTLQDIANAVNTVLSRHGFPTHHLDKYRYFVGSGISHLVYSSLPIEVSTSNNYSKYLQEVFFEYNQNLDQHTNLYIGIVQLLDALSTRKIPLAILSNKPDEFMDEVIQKYLYKWEFKVVFGARRNLPVKPDPYSALEIAETLEFPPQQIIFVGDSDIDMQTATNAGMFAVGACWGFRTAEELTNSGAKLLINEPIELLQLF